MINKVKTRVDGIASFPLDSEPPIIEERLRRSRTLNLSIYGKLEETQLKNLADEIRDEILAMEGVTHVEASGTRDFEISIELSDLALRQYDLQFDDVVNTIRSQSRDLPGGTLRTEAGSITLRSISQAYTAEDYSALTLLTRPDGTRITVGDVAVVRDAFEDQPLLSRFNGQPSINLLVDRVGRQDVLAINKKVKAYTLMKQQQLPEGVSLSVWADRTIVLKSRISFAIEKCGPGHIAGHDHPCAVSAVVVGFLGGHGAAVLLSGRAFYYEFPGYGFISQYHLAVRFYFGARDTG